MPAGWVWPRIESSSASSQTRVHYYRSISSLQHDPSALSPDHPDSPMRRSPSRRRWRGSTGWAVTVHPAPAAHERELELVHSAAHVRRIREICAARRRPDRCRHLRRRALLRGGPARRRRRLRDGARAPRRRGRAPPSAPCGRPVTTPTRPRDGLLPVQQRRGRRRAGHPRARRQARGRSSTGTSTTATAPPRSSAAAPTSCSRASTRRGLYPGTGALTDVGRARGAATRSTCPVPPAPSEEVWLSRARARRAPGGRRVRARADPDLGRLRRAPRRPARGLPLETSSFAQMACHVRDLAAARRAGRRGARGRLRPGGSRVLATVALAGEGEAESIAPDPLVTSRVAAHVGHYWPL